MQDTQALLDKARDLGESIARHERVKSYYAAQHGVGKDPAAKALLMEYAQHMDRLRQLESEQKPIEVADKQKAAEIEAQIAGNDRLKELMRVQADYVELMNQVNNAMGAPLSNLTGGEETA